MIRRLQHRRTAGRAAGFLLALLHLGATSVAALDAMIDGETAGTPIHYESQEATHCEAHHDHLFCQVVRSLGAASGAAIGATIDAAGIELAYRVGPQQPQVVLSATRPGIVGPRGPPLF